MLKVVENYTLRRGWAVSASLGIRWCVRLWGRVHVPLHVCLCVYWPAKAGYALVTPVLSRVAARQAMQGAL